MVSLSALGGGLGGGLPSNSLSVMSKSVERVSGSAGVADTSMASAQSALQRKLRLKTSKQYKVITERGNSTAGKIKPRPASSLATTAGVKNNQSSSRQGSEGRSTNPTGGVVNVSAISAVPTSSQFKIL